MYRAVALAARDASIAMEDPNRDSRLDALLKSLRISFKGERLLLDERDVTDQLAAPDVSELASRFSTLPAVRARMRELQRAAGQSGKVVMEGRDIGTAVFPDAEFKFFLDADVKVRAARRFQELKAKGEKLTERQVLESLKQRDQRDTTRDLAPLRCAADAIMVDSTGLTIAQVVEQIKSHIAGKARGQRGT